MCEASLHTTAIQRSLLPCARMESCRREMLDHVIPLNEEHLCRLIRDYVHNHQEDRVHDSLKKDTPNRPAVELKPTPDATLISVSRGAVPAVPATGGTAPMSATRAEPGVLYRFRAAGRRQIEEFGPRFGRRARRRRRAAQIRVNRAFRRILPSQKVVFLEATGDAARPFQTYADPLRK